MADDLKAQAVVEILKAGNGAREAAEDLRGLSGVAKGVASQLKEAGAPMEGFIGGLKGIKNGLVGLIGGYEVVNFLRESVQEFAAAEAGVARLDGTLRASGQYSRQYSAFLRELSEGFSRLTTASDGAVLQAEQQLISFGATRDQIEDLTRASLDLAAGLQIDLTSAAQLVGRALAGEGMAFKRLGFDVDETASKSRQFAQILEQIQARFGGLAQGEVQTFSGSLKQLNNDVASIKQNIGEVLVNTFGPMLSDLRELTKETTEWSSRNKELLQQFVSMPGMLGFWAKHKEVLKGVVEEQAKYNLLVGRLAAGLFVAPTAPGAGMAIATGTAGSSPGRSNQMVGPLIGPGDDAFTGPMPDPQNAIIAAREAEMTRQAIELTKELHLQQLDGFELERKQAQQNFELREKQITKLYEDGAELKEVLRATSANTDARDATLKRIDERERLAAAERNAAAAEITRATLSKEADNQILQLDRQLTLEAIENSDGRVAQAVIEFHRRVDLYEQLRDRGALTEEEYTAKVEEAEFNRSRIVAEETKKRMEQAKKEAMQFAREIEDLKKGVMEDFARGFSHSIVEGFRSGKFEMKQFFSDFFAYVAEAILQLLIIKALRATSFFGGGGILPSGAASGGVFFAANGYSNGPMDGVGWVDQATYFPRHNVVAGEAGREALTVLSRPRLEQWGAYPVMTGSVQGRQMAVMSREALASAGSSGGAAPGPVEIHITMDPGLRADVANQAAGAAVVRVTQDLSQDSALRRSVAQIGRVG